METALICSMYMASYAFLMYRRKKRLQQEKEKRVHKIWKRGWLPTHRGTNDYIRFMNLLVKKDIAAFRSRLRMEPWCFELLLGHVHHLILRENTRFRYAIAPDVRLSLTLRFLSSGLDPTTLQDLYQVGYSTVNAIILDTCRAIVKCLAPKYLTPPKTAAEWALISAGFSKKFQYHGCLGAIDGKHIKIVRPPNSGSKYWNYKQFYSIVLMAVVDFNYEFVYINVGGEGSNSDGGTWQGTEFRHALEQNLLNLPELCDLPGSDIAVPYHFVADDTFQLSERILKPYSGTRLNMDQDVFSYRLSRARMVVENSFGIISSRFKILQKAIYMKPENAEDVVMAICCLHNFLRREAGRNYLPRGDLDVEIGAQHRRRNGNWRNDPRATLVPLAATRRKNASDKAKTMRNQLAQYYAGVGAVPWQWQRINRSYAGFMANVFNQ